MTSLELRTSSWRRASLQPSDTSAGFGVIRSSAEGDTATKVAGSEMLDFVLDEKGVRMFVDMFSAQYLNGVQIDYVTGVMGSGFTFTNPNATGSCGCGSSFTA